MNHLVLPALFNEGSSQGWPKQAVAHPRPILSLSVGSSFCYKLHYYLLLSVMIMCVCYCHLNYSKITELFYNCMGSVPSHLCPSILIQYCPPHVSCWAVCFIQGPPTWVTLAQLPSSCMGQPFKLHRPKNSVDPIQDRWWCFLSKCLTLGSFYSGKICIELANGIFICWTLSWKWRFRLILILSVKIIWRYFATYSYYADLLGTGIKP